MHSLTHYHFLRTNNVWGVMCYFMFLMAYHSLFFCNLMCKVYLQLCIRNLAYFLYIGLHVYLTGCNMLWIFHCQQITWGMTCLFNRLLNLFLIVQKKDKTYFDMLLEIMLFPSPLTAPNFLIILNPNVTILLESSAEMFLLTLFIFILYYKIA